MSSEPYLKLDERVLREEFNRRPFAFKHNLTDHPQLQLSALYELASRLPKGEVLHWSGFDPCRRKHRYGVEDALDRCVAA